MGFWDDDKDEEKAGARDAEAGRVRDGLRGLFTDKKTQDTKQDAYDRGYYSSKGKIDGDNATATSDVLKGFESILFSDGHDGRTDKIYKDSYREAVHKKHGGSGDGGGSGGGTGGTGISSSSTSGGGASGLPAGADFIPPLTIIFGLILFGYIAAQWRPSPVQRPVASQPQTVAPSRPEQTVEAREPNIEIEYLALVEGVDERYQPLSVTQELVINHRYGSPVREGFGAEFRFSGAIPEQTRLRAEIWRAEGRQAIGTCLPDRRSWRQHAMGDWIAATSEGVFVCAYQGPMLGVGDYRIDVIVDGISVNSLGFRVVQSRVTPTAPIGELPQELEQQELGSQSRQIGMPESLVGRWSAPVDGSGTERFVDFILVRGRLNESAGSVGYRVGPRHLANAHDNCISQLALRDSRENVVLVEEVPDPDNDACREARMIVIEYSRGRVAAAWFQRQPPGADPSRRIQLMRAELGRWR